MKIILFAGGTGKRFWPVSRRNAPKQFSPLITGKPLLRVRIELLLKEFAPQDIFISTGKKYKKEVLSIAPELPDENFIFEPEMRDTGPAVTLAITYVYSKFPDETISVQWSDHLIKDSDEFLKALKYSDKKVNETCKAVLLAVPARFPSPHRGYINFDKHIEKVSVKSNVYAFNAFTEKPSVERAKKFIQKGTYAWNPGYWNMKGSYFLKTINKYNPGIGDVCKEIVESKFEKDALFSTLEKNSADYMFAEHIKPEEATVLLSDIGWSDVGEWIALKEALQASDKSNVTKGNVFDMDSEDSLIFNLDDSKLVSTIGLKGMVVVNTKDSVAVFNKEDNTKLKKYLLKLEKEFGDKYL